MIRQYELIDKVLSYNPQADVALINRAYVYSMKAHGNQKRASGQPYLVHPLEVAFILAELKLDDASICVGLLHDTLEDTLTTYDELKNLFGEDIASLTEGVTKLSRISFGDKAVEQAENFRKLLLAMSKDIRVLLVKLADRLHNVRTLDAVSKEEKRRRKAQETMDIFVPLADRIGLHSVKTELEDICFRILEPIEADRIETRMEEWRAQDSLVEKTLEALQEELANAKVDARVSGREKTVYSIHRKMSRKKLTFDQLADIFAYRIIVKNKRECYNVLGLMHDVYKAIPGRFKDYISAPKPNGYQSLHTALIGPYGNRMEVQIRTQQMHDVAESGVAAHWLYKENDNNKNKSEEHQYRWLRQLMDSLQGMEDPQEFYENARLELFSDNVFVFTPRGDLFALPYGATPLDFAYHIHSDIGHRCQSARVNGRVMPLRTTLQTGDMVEIMTNKGQQPTPGWREFVVTAKAKQAINRYLRTQERDDQVKLGKSILDKAAKRDGYKVKEKELSRTLSDLDIEQLDEAYVAMAQGRLFPRQVFDIMFPEEEKPKNEEHMPTGAATKVDDKNAIGLEGLTSGMSIHMAKCCNPVPGEKIVGIITTGRGVTIHCKTCLNLAALSDQPDRWLPVNWSGGNKQEQVYVARLRMTVKQDPGALSTVSTTVFNSDGNIIDIQIENRASDCYVLRCDVEVKSIKHLEEIMKKVKALKVVLSVERVSG